MRISWCTVDCAGTEICAGICMSATLQLAVNMTVVVNGFSSISVCCLRCLTVVDSLMVAMTPGRTARYCIS